MCIDTCEKLSCHLYILNMTTQNPLIHVQTTTTTPTTTSVHSPMQVVSSPPQQLHVVSGTRTLQVLDVLLFQNVFVFFAVTFLALVTAILNVVFVRKDEARKKTLGIVDGGEVLGGH